MSSSAIAIRRRLALADGMRQERAFKILYNGSVDEPAQGRYNSVFYKIPPHGETMDPCQTDPTYAVTSLIESRGDCGCRPDGKPAPCSGAIHVFNGELKVFDVYEAPRDQWRLYHEREKQGRSVKPPTATELKTQAIAVVAHLAGTQTLAERGIVILTGDPAKDKALRKEARALAMAWDRKRCEGILRAYNEALGAFKANTRNTNSRFRDMSDLERRAQEKLDMYTAGLELPERMKCPVRDCGYWAEGEDASKKMSIHISARYDDIEGLEVAEDVEDAEPEKVKARKRA